MKRIFTIIAALLALILVACEKETVLTIDQTSLSFTDTGGSQTISLTANKPWSVKCDQSWCKVSPSSGEEAVISKISISCDANTSYDARNCIVTFTCAELTKTVSVSQATNNGLLVSQTSYELTKAAQQLNIQVQANVKFSVEVGPNCKDWITYKTTKGLTTNTIVLDITENKSYDSREGKVTIKQDGGNLSSTIMIKQSQLDGLFITTPEYNLSNEKHTLTVEVSTNVEFEVTPKADWVKYIQTKGLSSKQIILEVAENDTYDQRETTITVKQKNGDLSGTIKIKQDEKYGILVTQSEYTLSNEAQTINVDVKFNVDFDVIIPEECKDWVSVVGTKGLSSRTYTFAVTKNETYDNREGSVSFKQKDGPASGTIIINQAQQNAIIVEQTEFNLSKEAQTINVNVCSNIEYILSINVDWIEFIETKSLESSALSFSIMENTSLEARVGYISFKEGTSGKEAIVTINQLPTEGIFVSPASFNLTRDEQEIEITVTANIEYEEFVLYGTGNNWLINSGITESDTKLSKVFHYSIPVNNETYERIGTIRFQQKGGPLYQEVNISQKASPYVVVSYFDSTISSLQQDVCLELLGTSLSSESRIEYISSEDWLIFKGFGPNVSIVYFSAEENTSTSPRKTTITLKDKYSSWKKELVLTQKGKRDVPEGAVDLGLSVFWATCNLGASNPEEYGGYYSWGETIEKELYTRNTYKWAKRVNGELIFTKYNNNAHAILEMEDDAARQIMGEPWRMPTVSEWEELYHKCRISTASINGIEGWLAISSITGNTIFFPFAGFKVDDGLYQAGLYFGLWTSELYFTPSYYLAKFITNSVGGGIYARDRYVGFSIRGVYDY